MFHSLSQQSESDEIRRTSYHYCIIGAGPAGLQLGYFMARAGRDYVIFERTNISGKLLVVLILVSVCAFYSTMLFKVMLSIPPCCIVYTVLLSIRPCWKQLCYAYDYVAYDCVMYRYFRLEANLLIVKKKL